MFGDSDISGNSSKGIADHSDHQDMATENYADMALTHRATVPTSPITNGVFVLKVDGMTLENHNFITTSAPVTNWTEFVKWDSLMSGLIRVICVNCGI